MRLPKKRKSVIQGKYALGLTLLLLIIIVLVWFSYAYINLLLGRNNLYKGNLDRAHKHFLSVSATGLFHLKTYTGIEIIKILNANYPDNPEFFDKNQCEALEFYNHRRLLENLINQSKYEIAFHYSQMLLSCNPEPEVIYYSGIAATAIGKYEEAANMFLSLSEDNAYHIKAEEKLSMLEGIADESFFSVKDRHGAKIAKSFSEINNHSNGEEHLKYILPLMQLYENDLYNSVILTIDNRIQKASEETLGGLSGILISISPQTGDILSMAASGQCLNEKFYFKKFQPGFLINIVTTIAARENNLNTQSMTIDCPREKKIGDITIFNNQVSKAPINIANALESGCLSYFAELALMIGNENIEDTAKRLFFNTPINLGAESVNIAKMIINNRDKTLAKFSTGIYDSWTTPIHLALIASTVAAKGPVYKPRLILDKRNINGESYYKEKPILLKISAEESAFDPIANAFVNIGAKISKNELFGAFYAYSGGLSTSFSWILIGYYPLDEPKIAFSLILVDDSATEENIKKKAVQFISEISNMNIY